MVLIKLRGAGGVVTGTCVLKSFRFRSARFSRVALVLKPWPLVGGGGGVLLGILRGVEQPGSGLILYQKKLSFSTSFFSPGLWAEIMSKNSQIFLFLSYSLIWNWNDKYVLTRHIFPRKPYPIPNQEEQSVYPFLDRKSAKTISFWVAHTYVAYGVYKGENPSILKVLSAGLSAL